MSLVGQRGNTHRTRPVYLGEQPGTGGISQRGVARMAILTRQVCPSAYAAPQTMLDKHFLRKHGPNTYYGQR